MGNVIRCRSLWWVIIFLEEENKARNTHRQWRYLLKTESDAASCRGLCIGLLCRDYFSPKETIKIIMDTSKKTKAYGIRRKGGGEKTYCIWCHASAEVGQNDSDFAHHWSFFSHDMKRSNYISYYWVRIWYFELFLESVCCGVILRSRRGSE